MIQSVKVGPLKLGQPKKFSGPTVVSAVFEVSFILYFSILFALCNISVSIFPFCEYFTMLPSAVISGYDVNYKDKCKLFPKRHKILLGA